MTEVMTPQDGTPVPGRAAAAYDPRLTNDDLAP